MIQGYKLSSRSCAKVSRFGLAEAVRGADFQRMLARNSAFSGFQGLRPSVKPLCSFSGVIEHHRCNSEPFALELAGRPHAP